MWLSVVAKRADEMAEGSIREIERNPRLEGAPERRQQALALAVTAWLATAFLLPCALVTDARAQESGAVDLTNQARKLLQEDRLVEALAQLDRAIEADADYWQAHYQRGRALALMERMDEALASLLRSTELNPGFAHAHQLASLAAARLDDYDTAWDQAIRAYLAGADMTQGFADLVQHATPPDDIDYRINALKVFVADVSIAEVEARTELPFNRNPQALPAPGFAGDRGNPDERPAAVQGQELLAESRLDLQIMLRYMRNALSRSPHFGLVLDVERADYALVISVDEIANEFPRRLEGYLRLYDIGSREVVYFRQIALADIGAGGSLHAELERYVGFMEGWVKEQREALIK